MLRRDGRQPRPITILGLSCLLGWTASVSQIEAQVGSPPRIRIVVIKGHGEEINIRKATPIRLIVEIRDELNRLVPGVQVLFRAPEGGPTIVFPNGTSSFVVPKNDQGLAAAQGQPNKEEGDFQVRVEAKFLDQQASALIDLRNVKRRGPGVLIGVLAGLGGAAAVGLLIRDGPPPPPPTPPPTTLGVGSVTVGPPP